MKNKVIVTGFSNVGKEGVTLHTNIPAKLKTGNVKGTSMWVSWDKIGAALLDNYTERSEVKDLKELRGEDERSQNEKRVIPDNRTLNEKIDAWDDGGCSTGMNDD